jgi:hypothetical protein
MSLSLFGDANGNKDDDVSHVGRETILTHERRRVGGKARAFRRCLNAKQRAGSTSTDAFS